MAKIKLGRANYGPPGKFDRGKEPEAEPEPDEERKERALALARTGADGGRALTRSGRAGAAGWCPLLGAGQPPGTACVSVCPSPPE